MVQYIKNSLCTLLDFDKKKIIQAVAIIQILSNCHMIYHLDQRPVNFQRVACTLEGVINDWRTN